MVEDIYSREKKHREELTKRMELAESESTELADKLRANVMKLEHMKFTYENKVQTLQSELDNAILNLQDRTSELNRIEGNNVKNMERIAELDNLLSDSQKVVNDMDRKLKATEEKNSKLNEQVDFISRLFGSVDEADLDSEKVREIAHKFK